MEPGGDLVSRGLPVKDLRQPQDDLVLLLQGQPMDLVRLQQAYVIRFLPVRGLASRFAQ